MLRIVCRVRASKLISRRSMWSLMIICRCAFRYSRWARRAARHVVFTVSSQASHLAGLSLASGIGPRPNSAPLAAYHLCISLRVRFLSASSETCWSLNALRTE
ncbi:hypothetical protein BC939DRAFT_471835, partial [Gamsiella multidivaricata]|uniref:uncharacterized protein n=1 Tax=Gamsiella multidivaricata TaxID=101098 RepID=UPI0022210736